MKTLLVLGNQLFSTDCLKKNGIDAKNFCIFMREDYELCTYYKFHKHKIIFFLAAMRNYAEELRQAGFTVHYEKMDSKKKNFESQLAAYLKSQDSSQLVTFEIEDKFFEKRIQDFVVKKKLSYEALASPLFMTSRSSFKKYLGNSKRPFMKTFYESQRKSLNILVDENKSPVGGKWSFDEMNRSPLPKSVTPPELPVIKSSDTVQQVIKTCDQIFPEHPGDSAQFWLPTTRSEASVWLDRFLDERLPFFGPYEDAIPQRSDFLFHSILTPFLNTGLLTPEEVIKKTLQVAKKKKINIQSVEGFIRQIIGWREFIHGIYQNFSERQETTNFWKHRRKLSSHWYEGTTGIVPLDHTLKKVIKYGYAHHIERLMVVGSLMLLLEVDPKDAHRWFMEMFIDSSDWVMGPNVYGMAIFSDGGIFATKPYICGSNYYRKMGGYKKEPWCDAVDGLYWQFIEKHQSFFLKNPRLSMMARAVEKMDPARKKLIFAKANELRENITEK